MLTVVWALAASVTFAGVVPQPTPPIPTQLKLNVLLVPLVFWTVNVSAYPLVFAVRDGAVPASGVTAPPVPAATVTLIQPLSPPPAMLTVTVPVPGFPVTYVTSKFAVVPVTTNTAEGAEQALTIPPGTQAFRLKGLLIPVLFVIENVVCIPAFEGACADVPFGFIVCADDRVGTSDATNAISAIERAAVRALMGSGSGY